MIRVDESSRPRPLRKATNRVSPPLRPSVGFFSCGDQKVQVVPSGILEEVIMEMSSIAVSSFGTIIPFLNPSLWHRGAQFATQVNALTQKLSLRTTFRNESDIL